MDDNQQLGPLGVAAIAVGGVLLAVVLAMGAVREIRGVPVPNSIVNPTSH